MDIETTYSNTHERVGNDNDPEHEEIEFEKDIHNLLDSHFDSLQPLEFGYSRSGG